MKMYTIKHVKGRCLHSGRYESFRECIEDAVCECINLKCADLRGINLRNAYLGGADLKGADLEGANLKGADLEGANLEYANLDGADLRDTDLRWAGLEGADLDNAIGIEYYGPIGEWYRTIYAVKHKDCVMFQIGCFWGTYEKALKAVGEKYGEDSEYYQAIEKLHSELQD